MAPLNGNGSRVCPEKTKGRHRRAGNDSVLRSGKRVELGAIRQAQIVAVVKFAEPPTFSEAVGPNTIPAGFIRNRLALPKPVVCRVPKILEGLPPVTRLRIFEVGNAVSFRKLAR